MDADENILLKSEEKIKLEQDIADLEEELETIDDNISLLNEEYQKHVHNDDPQHNSKVGEVLLEEIRKYHVAEANLKQKKCENIQTMGKHEFTMEQNLSKMKVKNEVYFGTDCYVGNSMHKIYANFLRGDTTLIDGFKDENPQLFHKLHDLWMILSKNHKYFSTPKTTKAQKEEAAEVCASFTKKFPVYFPEANITHKMHV